MKGLRATPYWIPACAGMTTEVREEFSCRGSGAICLSQPSFASRVPSIRGVQRGEAPLPGVRGCPSVPFFFSPKIGGQGVEEPNYAKRQIPGYSLAGGSSDAELRESQKPDYLLFSVQKV